ncbi:rRNA maturation RNase YbeY [uncultured Cytophaga sp.]|uniref:rRNA maturation RNase YbeY n=1 Tax=uncultured Cytophaga sp. TaxID=160238 RepID=UPI00260D9714|nr:rRNA maturation RNase YbeY [uncultured Cytophaga sp.]
MPEALIHFFTEDITYQLRQRTEIRSWLNTIAKKEKYSILELNYIFCSDEYLLQMNKDFLNHDYYTDVITFDNSEFKGEIEGDIFISIDRVRDNAKLQQTTLKDELHRVLAHGLLHLTGYKDKTKVESTLMRTKEDTSLALRTF